MAYMNDDNFFNWLGKLVNKVVTNALAWNIPAAKVTALTTRRAWYEPLYHKAQEKDERTKADVDRHRQARKLYEKELQVFVNGYIRYNEDIPRDEKIAMGVPPRDLEPTPSPVITDTPYMKLSTIGRARIEVRSQTTEDATRPSMPSFANLVECRFVILEQGDIAPDHPENFPKKEVSSRAKFILNVGEQNAGKRFHGVFRWVHTGKPKQEGPWTDPISITIM